MGLDFEEWLSDKHLGSMELEFSKGAFAAGAASRDAEVVSLTNQRDYEYVRAENAEQERDQFEQERDQLREQVKMLRDKLIYADLILDKDYNHVVPSIKRALAATEPK